MSPADWATLVSVLLGAGTVASLVGWTRAGTVPWVPAAVLLLAAAALTAALPDAVEPAGHLGRTVLVTLAGTLAVVGGGPVTTAVFGLADRERCDADRSTLGAGRVLRGGAWIGALERAAVLAALAAGLPEGVAVVLAVKGLGRYPELRAAEEREPTGAAERFIIGTFTSVLWAAACAGVLLLALG